MSVANSEDGLLSVELASQYIITRIKNATHCNCEVSLHELLQHLLQQ